MLHPQWHKCRGFSCYPQFATKVAHHDLVPRCAVLDQPDNFSLLNDFCANSVAHRVVPPKSSYNNLHVPFTCDLLPTYRIVAHATYPQVKWGLHFHKHIRASYMLFFIFTLLLVNCSLGRRSFWHLLLLCHCIIQKLQYASSRAPAQLRTRRLHHH